MADDPAAVGGRHRQTARLVALVDGDVQGVGFRWWVRSLAGELGVLGHAVNLPDGRVEVAAEAPEPVCQRLLTLLSERPSTARRPGRVTSVVSRWEQPVGDRRFDVS